MSLNRQLNIAFCLLIVTTSLRVSAREPHNQPLKRSWHIRAYAQAGKVFNTNSFLNGENLNNQKVNRYHSFSIQAGCQTYGSEAWQAIWAYPSYGFGFSFPDFYIDDELGRPFTIYGYFMAPFKRWGRASLNYEIGFGAALNWKPYNAETNPYNVAIGSFASLFADWGVFFRYGITKNIDIDAGATLSHFSNGAIAMPNKGINTVGPRIALRYNFRKEMPEYKSWEVPAYKDNWELQIILAGAVKELPYDTSTMEDRRSVIGVTYGIMTLDAILHRQISYKVKIGAGLDLAYNGSANANFRLEGDDIVKLPVDASYKLSLAILGSLELVFYRLSINIQPGYYILRKKYDPQPPEFFQRVGVKYHFTKSENWFAGVTIRAYDFQVADYIEWNVGYRIRWPARKRQ